MGSHALIFAVRPLNLTSSPRLRSAPPSPYFIAAPPQCAPFTLLHSRASAVRPLRVSSQPRLEHGRLLTGFTLFNSVHKA